MDSVICVSIRYTPNNDYAQTYLDIKDSNSASSSVCLINWFGGFRDIEIVFGWPTGQAGRQVLSAFHFEETKINRQKHYDI